MHDRLTIDYYTDILCVWAWIAQRRIEELETQWGERLEIRHHCVNVFGDTEEKMRRQWSDRGGFDGFAGHVQSAAAAYEEAPVNPTLWQQVRPTTSGAAHLLLKAAELIATAEQAVALATRIRQAFFIDAVDISQLRSLLEIAADCGLEESDLTAVLESGEAMARLLTDYGEAERQNITGSPSWVMNEGRQVLYGNVGYRILHANVEELLRHPDQEASWC